jgi:hypothetical protein
LYNSKVAIQNQDISNRRKNPAGSAILAEVDSACLELINCTRQRGRLRISKHACALRYLLAQKRDLRFPEDEFGMARKAGLEICRNCSEGRSYANVEKVHQQEHEEVKDQVSASGG